MIDKKEKQFVHNDPCKKTFKEHEERKQNLLLIYEAEEGARN